jgi:hypothetical protein
MSREISKKIKVVVKVVKAIDRHHGVTMKTTGYADTITMEDLFQPFKEGEVVTITLEN